MQGGKVGWGPKIIKLSAMAQFWVYHVKQLLRVMGAGSRVVWMRHWQWWGLAFDNVRQGKGLGPKIETELLWLGFRLDLGCQRWRGFCGITGPPATVI